MLAASQSAGPCDSRDSVTRDPTVRLPEYPRHCLLYHRPMLRTWPVLLRATMRQN